MVVCFMCFFFINSIWIVEMIKIIDGVIFMVVSWVILNIFCRFLEFVFFIWYWIGMSINENVYVEKMVVIMWWEVIKIMYFRGKVMVMYWLIVMVIKFVMDVYMNNDVSIIWYLWL